MPTNGGQNVYCFHPLWKLKYFSFQWDFLEHLTRTGKANILENSRFVEKMFGF
jgi:hypothetical protein